MTSRLGILVGVLTIAAGITWFALRSRGSADESSANRAPEGSDTLTAGPPATRPGAVTSRDGKIDVSPKNRPERLGGLAEAPLPPTTTAFEAEVRDAEWATETETEIKRRFAVGVREGRLEATECRQQQCLLTMSGSEAEMSRVLADLETEGGLRGYADHVVLDGPVQQDGKLIVRAYAVFDRTAKGPDPGTGHVNGPH